MAKELGFGVVGLGMGGHHCKAIIKAKGARLVAVCDHDKERLEQRVKEFNCKGYLSYAEMLKDPEIDVVNIATESGKHAAMGIQAARAGKHIIVEKPVDITPKKITELEKVVKETGVKCGCIFQYRMDNCNKFIRQAISKGHMGKIIGVHAHLPWYRADSYYSGKFGTWRGTWKLDGGGSLMNQGIHTLDLAIFLAGPVKRVAGFYGVFNHKIEAEDQVVAVLEFENGALGTLFTTTCAIPEGAQRIYMYGSKGSFSRHGGTLEFYEMGPDKDRKRMMELFSGKPMSDAASKDPMAVSADGHMLIVEDMVKAIRLNREPAIPIAEARKSVDTACAIYKSARTGKMVEVASVRK
ncbi:MAG TPA: Gfo/Idh/MocA family oxidoreductase [Candidatus Hydrogenedentes bacterium]|nr:Gfo/Idh/MocA family oxidoreductase [Candidatus Hydrogenedentota bacterium]HOL76302.1 Gfo/Idh/MocA family oxidoreductase [Candidatus Hydrogenedentota bacterium]HPO86129.1 Gfo/Idh/MocA family oxidoreductase [Candidatus Hydrogenedentota bacterium]